MNTPAAPAPPADEASDACEAAELTELLQQLAGQVHALTGQIERLRELNDSMSMALTDVARRYGELDRRIENLRHNRRASDRHPASGGSPA